MRKILLPFIILLFATAGKAQYVTLPDTLFRNFLIGKYPTCFNASKQMDTTCNAIVSETDLFINNSSNINNLNGLQYFDSLKNLQCFGMPSLTTIPSLPNSLTYFSCNENNNLTILPAALPSSLNKFYCYNNRILTSLPTLSNSLT
jgi:hypothetical protein